MTATPSGEMPPVYAVRLAHTARETLLREHARLTETASPAQADDWYAAILETLHTLATYPERCPIAPEDAFVAGANVRQRLYSRRRGQAWRILFSVHEANADDPPTVRVHHIRHSAQVALTEWPAEPL